MSILLNEPAFCMTSLVKVWHGSGVILLLTLSYVFVFKRAYLQNCKSILSKYFVIQLIVLIYSLTGCVPVVPADQLVNSPSKPGTANGAPRVANPTKPPVTAGLGMAVPVFTPQTGKLPFGSNIRLSVSRLPDGAVYEYSYDGGKTWLAGDQVPVTSSQPILARTRINDLVSEPAQASFSPYFQRMLIIGNSIMSHAPAPELGWYNSNGMAASAPEKDFVHLLAKQLTAIYPQATYQLLSGGIFERTFGAFNLDEFNQTLQQFKPDLIIVRLGENVDEGDVNDTNFAQAYERLLDRLVKFSGPVKVICTTSVWKKPRANEAIRKVAAKKGYALAELNVIEGQDQFFAFGQYANPAVGSHPNDAGMQRIADLIWEKVQ